MSFFFLFFFGKHFSLCNTTMMLNNNCMFRELGLLLLLGLMVLLADRQCCWSCYHTTITVFFFGLKFFLLSCFGFFSQVKKKQKNAHTSYHCHNCQCLKHSWLVVIVLWLAWHGKPRIIGNISAVRWFVQLILFSFRVHSPLLLLLLLFFCLSFCLIPVLLLVFFSVFNHVEIV